MKSPKICKKFKEVENEEGTKNVSISHILRNLSNIEVFLKYAFFGNHLKALYVWWTRLNRFQSICSVT